MKQIDDGIFEIPGYGKIIERKSDSTEVAALELENFLRLIDVASKLT